MCNFKATPDNVTLFNALAMSDMEIEKFEQQYYQNAFTHPRDPVMTIDEPHKIQLINWGMIPWAQDPKDALIQAKKYINVTCEKIDTTYKRFYKQRGITFATGFYEWKWLDKAGKQKQPYFIYPPPGELLAMGVLYNTWNDPTGSVAATKTHGIVTTVANELMAEIHNKHEDKKRMPYIIKRECWSDWLNPDATIDDLKAMMQPLPDGYLQAHKVSPDISKRDIDHNVPETQAPLFITPEHNPANLFPGFE